MMQEKKKVIGIVGGMGPHAGLLLYNAILEQTDASSDQDHLSVVLMSFPSEIVDRTAFLLGRNSVNPAFGITRMIKQLNSIGAEVIGLACNTAYAPRIQNKVNSLLAKSSVIVDVVDMPFETCLAVKKDSRNIRRVGVLGTEGTYLSKIYEEALSNVGLEAIIPNNSFQVNIIHRMIYDEKFGIKANPNKISEGVYLLMDKAITFFKEKNADAIILGCTELSLLHKASPILDIPVFDSTNILADTLIRRAKYSSEPYIQTLERRGVYKKSKDKDTKPLMREF